MIASDANQLLNPLAFVTLGTVLGALLNKIFTNFDRSNLYWWFYGFSGLCFCFLIYTIYATSWAAPGGTWYFTLVCNIALVIITRFVLKTKNIYKTDELDPVINEFTGKADKEYINLLCGDIDFFGATPNEMDRHAQYTYLKAAGFKKINILCTRPKNNSERIRYGKILTDIPAVSVRYYKPTAANLSLRGRITRFQGGDRLLMYFKVSTKVYRAIETDTSDSNGALYKNIWELIWNLAEVPEKAEIDGFIDIAAK
jgi:hypothetical protein